MLFIHTRNIQNIYSQIIYTQSDKKSNNIHFRSSYKHNIYSENKFRHIKAFIQHQTQSKKMRKNVITEEKYSSPTLFPQGFESLKIQEYFFSSITFLNPHFFKRLKCVPLRYLSLNFYYRKRMETEKIYFTCDFLDNFCSQSIDFKYKKIRHYQKKYA